MQHHIIKPTTYHWAIFFFRYFSMLLLIITSFSYKNLLLKPIIVFLNMGEFSISHRMERKVARQIKYHSLAAGGKN